MYIDAVDTLADPTMTTVILVARPEKTPLLEAKRASEELKDIGVNNQTMIINGVLDLETTEDEIALSFYNKQQQALQDMPEYLCNITTYYIPLRAYNVYGVKNVRRMLTDNSVDEIEYAAKINGVQSLGAL
jgi:arsenite-transporting ATPase